MAPADRRFPRIVSTVLGLVITSTKHKLLRRRQDSMSPLRVGRVVRRRTLNQRYGVHNSHRRGPGCGGGQGIQQIPSLGTNLHLCRKPLVRPERTRFKKYFQVPIRPRTQLICDSTSTLKYHQTPHPIRLRNAPDLKQYPASERVRHRLCIKHAHLMQRISPQSHFCLQSVQRYLKIHHVNPAKINRSCSKDMDCKPAGINAFCSQPPRSGMFSRSILGYRV